MQEITSHIYSNDKIAKNLAKLLGALVESNGIEEIVNIGFEILGNPISVSDTNYKILALTKNLHLNNSSWNRTSEGVQLPDEIYRSETKEFFKKARSSKYPILNKPQYTDFEVLHSGIFFKDILLGYIIVPSHLKPFGEYDIEVVAVLSKVLSLEMRKNRFSHDPKCIMYELFIGDLLESNFPNRDEINEQLKTLKWELQENIFLISISWKKYNDDNLVLIKFCEAISNLILNSKAIIYNNQIVVIANSKKRDFFKQAYLGVLLDFMRNNDLIGCVSRSFHSLLELPLHYRQTAKVVEIAISMGVKKELFEYDEYALSSLLAMCFSREDLKFFCHPSLGFLSEYDQKYGTKLTLSLYEYLTHNKNIIKAACILGIHRNTLRLRLDSIVKITGIAIENEDISLHLLLSFKIQQFFNCRVIDKEEMGKDNFFNNFSFHVQ